MQSHAMILKVKEGRQEVSTWLPLDQTELLKSLEWSRGVGVKGAHINRLSAHPTLVFLSWLGEGKINTVAVLNDNVSKLNCS